MKILGAAMAAALLITGPALAQGIDDPSDQQGTTSGMGVERSAGDTQEDVLPAPTQPQEDVVPAPAQPAPDGATGGTEETIVPGAEEGGMDGATPLDGDAGQVEPYSGSQSRGEFGSPAESGSSLGTEADISETAIPAEMLTVTGTIRKMDMNKGKLVLKADDGKNIELHADKAMLQGEQFKKGKRVTAQYQKQDKMNHVTSLAPADDMGGAMPEPGSEKQ